MDFKKIKKIDTEEQYKLVVQKVDELIKEATQKCILESENDNEYTREIGRLGILAAQYENECMKFEHIKTKSPLIKSIEDVMYSRNINQKDLAEIIGINEPTLSQIMRGKRRISMNVAKKLYKSLHIDPKLIVEYA
ncbi:MAG: helix-turn-helix domain-containing protein [Prevotellaceae bacterium]|nr:helix-turn-helix domain-containing protein [Prevotellaceae bacterium]